MTQTPLFRQNFEDPLFSVAFNPSASNYVVGLSSGQVSAYTFNNEGFEEIWTTKRHKQSCRALGYDQDGQCMYRQHTL
jgi:WD repeat-containing protein 55